MRSIDERPVVLLVDNSVSFTGALKCALQQARLMKEHYRYEFVLPQKSTAIHFIREQGMPVHTLPMIEIKRQVAPLVKYPFALLKNAFKLNSLIRRRGVQLLVLNDYYNLLGSGVRMLNKKIRIITYVRMQPSGMPGVLNRLWTGAALWCSNLVIAVSETVRRQLPAHAKVCRVYDAVAFTEKHPQQNQEGATVNLLCLGNYIRGKGQDHALKAFAGAYRQNSSLRLHLYGSDMGLEKNRIFKKELEAFVVRNHLTEVVQSLPFVQDVEAVYKRADIFLNFSESESFSMTCAEAAFYGVPIIASRCGGPEEIVIHNKTGLLVANKDTAQMQAAMLVLAGDKEKRKTFGLCGARYVREQFSPEEYVLRLLGLLEKTINKKTLA